MKTIFCLLLLSLLPAQGQTPQPVVTVDASTHSSLQAALDAVPEGGGLETIPPGRYVITEPLRWKTPRWGSMQGWAYCWRAVLTA